MIFFLLYGTGCRKFLDLKTPITKTEAKGIYENNETANMVLFNMYGSMFYEEASPYRLARNSGFCADELKPAWDPNAQELYINKISATNPYINNLWTGGYGFIRISNELYWGCNSSTGLDPAVRKRLMAEALFLRAYWFFYLTNFFGDIPLPTTTDINVNIMLPKTRKEDVYKQIISDLLSAQKDLEDNYVGTDGKSSSNERNRPNKATATALLARVYLYTKQYKEAEEQTSIIIAKNDTYALVPLDQVFLKNSMETIWQLSPITPNDGVINTTEGTGFILTEPPQNKMQQTVSSFLLDAFEEGDQRKVQWIGSYTDPNTDTTYYYPSKYKRSSGDDLTEYSMIFRLAEIYLIRAESRAHLGKMSAAISDLNRIKRRAGLAELNDTTIDINALSGIILKERRVELFTEQCHRWFDLKRTGNIDSVMNIVCPLKSGKWDSPMQLLPIPHADLKRAPNLVQNPGYEQ